MIAASLMGLLRKMRRTRRNGKKQVEESPGVLICVVFFPSNGPQLITDYSWLINWFNWFKFVVFLGFRWLARLACFSQSVVVKAAASKEKLAPWGRKREIKLALQQKWEWLWMGSELEDKPDALSAGQSWIKGLIWRLCRCCTLMLTCYMMLMSRSVCCLYVITDQFKVWQYFQGAGFKAWQINARKNNS